MKNLVNASMLYSYIQCPHRVTADLFFDRSTKLDESPFVQLLWERGHAFEKETINHVGYSYTDLSDLPSLEKEKATLEAMQRRDALIYGGRIISNDLVGEPDLLKFKDGEYVPVDIKSGAGEEGSGEDGDRKPKKHYAVQLGLYIDVLERLGFNRSKTGYIWDVHGQEVKYDFTVPRGPRTPGTLWDLYQEVLTDVRNIINKKSATKPALASCCKLCPWRKLCKEEVISQDDLTLIFELGREKRDAISSEVATVMELAKINVSQFVEGKKTRFPGIGPASLEKFQQRAQLLKSPESKAFLKNRILLPKHEIELFFDIETDPMRDICYLHGFIERRNGDNSTQKYVAFLAEEPNEAEEQKAFVEAWGYLRSLHPCAVYYYSPYERTIWRKLQNKYPDVLTEDELEKFFESEDVVDLYYDVVHPSTEWPTSDYSIKTLASWLKFSWRDTHPSGAASIEWYHQWVRSRDPQIKKRILEYNEDDCIATAVLLDGIKKLPLRVLQPEEVT